jgi:hypothetical protein
VLSIVASEESNVSRASRARQLNLLLVAAALTLTACHAPGPLPTDNPTHVYDPEVVGVIASIREIEGGVTVVLDDGRNVRIATGTPSIAGRISEGDLLFYGEEDGKAWYGTATPRDEPCFKLEGTAIDEGRLIRFSSGIRLPKAPDFDPGVATDGEYAWVGHFLCIDRSGEVRFFS